jgi:hypothetical protein
VTAGDGTFACAYWWRGCRLAFARYDEIGDIEVDHAGRVDSDRAACTVRQVLARW